jgi:hypothetical protein
MMVELIMTRQREQRLRTSIQRNLKYLLYTGADSQRTPSPAGQDCEDVHDG